MGLGVPPTLGNDAEDDAWWDALPEHLQEEINAVTDIIGPCVWLDLETRQCKHYDLRPATCRHFVPGDDLCLEDRRSQGIDAPQPDGERRDAT
jgi:uncharacterized protein